MPKKIQNFARSALVKPVTINVGRAGAASMNVVQVSITFLFSLITIVFVILIGSRICKTRGQNSISPGMLAKNSSTGSNLCGEEARR